MPTLNLGKVIGPTGLTGQTGPATELSVSGTTTGAAGSEASVTISGTAPNQSLAFTIPRGPQGIQGPTGSSGATALLTGYVSGAGTVAATDTVIQAVGKLNGNDELKAPIASLYPYIGGKLLTYLDEEEAIADPLISAGDIYRKTAGGVDYVNPDNVPSLDLRFATDKTLTARRGPTPTFTRASGATYIGSNGLIQSAAINTPRFDHDPVTLACKGLLIEEGRTNLFSSTNLNDWAAARCTKTAITGIGLTDQATTLTISEPINTFISRGATLTTGVAYAISVRVKAGTVASFNFGDLTDGKYSRGFNLSTNQWAASGGSVEFTNYRVTPNIDGWFLVSAIYTPTGATGVKNIAFLLVSPVVGQTVSFDTPQIEAGSFATSYIPTTTGTLARGADVCSITGGDFSGFYNQSEGTISINASTATPNNAVILYAISDGTNSNLIQALPASASFVVTALGVSQVSLNHGTFTTNVPSKQASAYKLDDFASSKNAGTVLTDNTGTIPAVNQMGIGSRHSSAQLNGHIASLRFYKKRLPDAKLQALTV
jgi:hypothetical protein